MYELMEFSGREYVDMYAQKVKDQQASADALEPAEPIGPIAA
jgi:1-acyl-sn-glycerol-3-phosphate acyltransferase